MRRAHACVLSSPLLVQGFSYLYLSEERSARFLSRRERFNASTPATVVPALRQ